MSGAVTLALSKSHINASCAIKQMPHRSPRRYRNIRTLQNKKR